MWGKDRRTHLEREMVERACRAVDPSVAITLLADRGFGDHTLDELLDLLG
ncbi:MAG: hypothetical protein AAF355_11535 [Myxococcota bacterium]